ncbi:nuclear transport factor 2 family protein [Bosea sp. BK604]|uniref:nuclear transport factor 2 family protein n=1 Tax=Bosea sp. BK604 TaxID=2512180 RepID=UPI00104B9B7F|nr:nuclear transport factor 2 family protein [Bosea sp. BK604]TCR62093.1 putative lumazine-binding protein [Bosea sp. BK604]
MTTQDTSSAGNIDGLVALAKIYFDAAYAMDADMFETIFDPTASVTRRGDGYSVVVTPVAAWLDVVRSLTSPRDAGSLRADQILSIAITRDMALLKLRLRIPPREVTDLLSCFYLNGRWQIVQKVFAAETLA